MPHRVGDSRSSCRGRPRRRRGTAVSAPVSPDTLVATSPHSTSGPTHPRPRPRSNPTPHLHLRRRDDCKTKAATRGEQLFTPSFFTRVDSHRTHFYSRWSAATCGPSARHTRETCRRSLLRGAVCGTGARLARVHLVLILLRRAPSSRVCFAPAQRTCDARSRRTGRASVRAARAGRRPRC